MKERVGGRCDDMYDQNLIPEQDGDARDDVVVTVRLLHL